MMTTVVKSEDACHNSLCSSLASLFSICFCSCFSSSGFLRHTLYSNTGIRRHYGSIFQKAFSRLVTIIICTHIPIYDRAMRGDIGSY